MEDMLKKEVVSIIVPVYGVEKYLSQCIESLINQTYRKIEIVLVDDGSKDRSGEICDEYASKDERIVVIHKQNGGLTSARNAGLEIASGDWIMHVDGDDWIEPNTVESLLETVDSVHADIVFADFWFDYPTKTEVSNFYDWKHQGNEGLKEFIATSWTCLCGSIQRRELYVENELKSPEQISYCEDFHLITRLCFFAERVSKVEIPLYHYRQQESSIMHNLSQKTWDDELWAYNDIISFFKSQGVYDEMKECMAWRSLKASQEMLLDERLFDSFRAYNPDKRNYVWNCPFIGVKLKIIGWLVNNNLKGIAKSIVRLRNRLRRR